MWLVVKRRNSRSMALLFQLLLALTMLSLLSMLCFGCGKPKLAEPEGKPIYTLTDATGTKVSFTKKPERIVSLSISTDEILLDLVEPKRIVALTKYVDDEGISNATEQAKAVKGRVQAGNPEAILALRPDLILIPDFSSADTIQSLREMQQPVYVYKTPSNLAGVRACIRELGQVVGEEAAAQLILQRMEARLALLQQKMGPIPAAKQKWVIFMSDKGAYYSPEHSFNDICKHAQLVNALSQLHFAKPITVGQEEIVRLNPDAFILSGWVDSTDQEPDALVHNLLQDPSYASVKAVKNKAIYALPAKHLLCLSQHIVEASYDLARAVYGQEL